MRLIVKARTHIFVLIFLLSIKYILFYSSIPYLNIFSLWKKKTTYLSIFNFRRLRCLHLDAEMIYERVRQTDTDPNLTENKWNKNESKVPLGLYSVNIDLLQLWTNLYWPNKYDTQQPEFLTISSLSQTKIIPPILLILEELLSDLVNISRRL